MESAIKATKKKRGALSVFNVKEGRMDYVFLLLVLLILTIGTVSLFSASFSNALARYDNSYHFISRQVIFGLGGIILMLFISRINHQVYNRWVWLIYSITLVLLVVVLFFPKINGARRWIILADAITFQPSEIAKFAIVVVYAHLVTINQQRMKTFRHGIVPPMVVLAPMVLLLLMEPHLSGTILIVVLAAVMLFVGGLSLRWFGILGATGVFGIWFVTATDIVPYASDRFKIWQNPYIDPLGKGFQTIQSLYAIGSGGVMGQGIGGSTQKYGYLPEVQNDYVFSIVCEELGFIGATIIIILFAFLVWRGLLIASRCPDRFGSLVAIGLTAQVGVQAIFNILVITGTVPPTGVSMPFFSSGGTSLIMLLAQMGIVLSISRHSAVTESKEE